MARWPSIIDDPPAPPPHTVPRALCTAEQRQVPDLVGGQDGSATAGLPPAPGAERVPGTGGGTAVAAAVSAREGSFLSSVL